MKIIFLDIDGCLNNKNTDWSNDGWGLDSYCVLLLHRILEATGAEVVLSSSWRYYPKGVEIVETALRPYKLYSMTETGKEAEEGRGSTIKRWLTQHPEVTEYAILDDANDFHKDQHLFQTSFETGLTEAVAQQVIDHFNLSP